LLDEIMTLIVAGHETTASALNWTWYLLSLHPAVEARMHREIDALPEEFDFDRITALSFTRQIIQESLRLYPPGWLLTRRAIAADVIGGYSVPAGADVFIAPYLVHRHPHFWENPDAFEPQRFSAECPLRNRFAYLPFALGPRACIGEQFAMLEMISHLFLLARRLRLRYLPQRPIELECQVNLRTKYPLTMQPELRP
jgi:cytochrome P450